MGVMMAGQNVAERNFMSYSRQQEVAADAAAIKFLNATHQSGAGMLKLFQILRRDETLSYGTLDPYAISHPLSEERIEHIRSEVLDAQMPDVDKYADQQARMVAKLHGFLEKPEITLLTYTDNSIPSLYARSIAYFQQSNFPKAFGALDKLLAQKPDDPFFNELEGQFLSESGHPKEALPYYERANKLYPNSSLIKTELGKLLLNSNRTDEAIQEFSQSAALEKTDTETWHLLATAYGKKNDEGMSSLALAEEANTSGKNSEARKFARRAKDKLPKNSPAWLRANDILADVKLHKKDDNDSDDDKS
jgi:predicted Zn-dependent protease